MGVCSSNCSTENKESVVGFSETADDFELVSILGVGSFGEISLCKWSSTGEYYAIKKIKKRRLFRRTDHSPLAWNERDAMVTTESPFCVELKCTYQTELAIFYVMPYYAGGDVLRLIKDHGTLHPEQVRFYLAEILLGLAGVHKQNICHRDMKPENILLDAEGHCALTDFGLAVEIDPYDENCPNRHWGLCGSYGYRALEVISDGICGFYSDIYALGIITYFLLYGKVPWAQTKLVYKGEPLAFPYLPKSSQRIPVLIKKLIIGMLQFDCRKRLTIEKIKQHEYFTSVNFDWEACEQKKLTPPIIPIEPTPAIPVPSELDEVEVPIDEEDQERFIGFDWVPGEPIVLFESLESRRSFQESSPRVSWHENDARESTPTYVKRAFDANRRHRGTSLSNIVIQNEKVKFSPFNSLQNSRQNSQQNSRPDSRASSRAGSPLLSPKSLSENLSEGANSINRAENGNSKEPNDGPKNESVSRRAANTQAALLDAATAHTKESCHSDDIRNSGDHTEQERPVPRNAHLHVPQQASTTADTGPIDPCWAISPAIPQRRMKHKNIKASLRKKIKNSGL